VQYTFVKEKMRFFECESSRGCGSALELIKTEFLCIQQVPKTDSYKEFEEWHLSQIRCDGKEI
jgi:hypothetical protein